MLIDPAHNSSSLMGRVGEMRCKEERSMRPPSFSKAIKSAAQETVDPEITEGPIPGKALRKLSLNMSFCNASYFIHLFI